MPSTRVDIGPTRGQYPGQATTVSYRIEMVDLSRPSAVALNGKIVTERVAGSTGPGWSYQPSTDTVTISAGPVPTSRALTFVETGGQPVQRVEPVSASPS
jgi:hypothetical protein